MPSSSPQSPGFIATGEVLADRVVKHLSDHTQDELPEAALAAINELAAAYKIGQKGHDLDLASRVDETPPGEDRRAFEVGLMVLHSMGVAGASAPSAINAILAALDVAD